MVSAVHVQVGREVGAGAKLVSLSAMKLDVAGVDLLRGADGPKVLEVNSSPGLEGIEKVSGKDISGLIIEHIETKVAPKPPRPKSRGKRIAG